MACDSVITRIAAPKARHRPRYGGRPTRKGCPYSGHEGMGGNAHASRFGKEKRPLAARQDSESASRPILRLAFL